MPFPLALAAPFGPDFTSPPVRSPQISRSHHPLAEPPPFPYLRSHNSGVFGSVDTQTVPNTNSF
jgi:hypothetical protein